MPIPSLFRAGDTVRWRDPAGVNWLNESVTNTDYACKYYLRCNASVASETITGTDYGQGWEFVIPAATSGAMNSGLWFFQAIATKSGDEVTLYEGQFEIKKKLSYTGTPGSDFEGRTQAEIDLEAVSAAIRSIISDKAKSYTIGNRTFTRLDLSELRMRESQLKAEVVRERKANMIANGLGNPHNLFVRF
tara:strand:- start:773 stop:1342 length:570 start_codon:yes stop_codon:yes gene_type:complete